MNCQHCGATLDVGALVCVECGREQRDASAAPPQRLQPEPDKAVDQPCPKHPALPIAGTCPRCGTFVCIRCAPGAASGVLTCTECLAREHQQYALKPSPFGGPLVFPLLGLVLNIIVFVTGMVMVTLQPTERSMTIAVVVMAIAVAGMCATLYGFLKRRRWVRAAMIANYAFGAIIALLTHGLTQAWVAWCVVWGAYFVVSARVKNTFTE